MVDADEVSECELLRYTWLHFLLLQRHLLIRQPLLCGQRHWSTASESFLLILCQMSKCFFSSLFSSEEIRRGRITYHFPAAVEGFSGTPVQSNAAQHISPAINHIFEAFNVLVQFLLVLVSVLWSHSLEGRCIEFYNKNWCFCFTSFLFPLCVNELARH